MVICVYAFVSAKDFKEYEKFMHKLTKMMMLEEAKAINFSTKAMRQNAEKKNPDEVVNREKVAARRERPIERKVFRRQTTQARAIRAVKCSLMPGKKSQKESR